MAYKFFVLTGQKLQEMNGTFTVFYFNADDPEHIEEMKREMPLAEIAIDFIVEMP